MGCQPSVACVTTSLDEFSSRRYNGEMNYVTRKSMGEKIRTLRVQRCLTQEDCAKRLGVTVPLLRKYERGEMDSYATFILRMCEVFGISADQMISPYPLITKTSRRLARV